MINFIHINPSKNKLWTKLRIVDKLKDQINSKL
jgi:hypothetical protein